MSRCIFVVLLVLSVCLPQVASAQPPEHLRGRSVVGVEIEGALGRKIPARDVGIPIGASLDRALLREAIRRLIDSGRFSDVQLDVRESGQGVTIVARLVPRRRVARIDVLGNEELADDELARAMGIITGDDFDEARLERGRERVVQAYKRLGFDAVEVAIETRATNDPGEEVVRIVVREGPATRIAEILVEGDMLPRRIRRRRRLGFKVGDVVDASRIEDGVRAGEEKLRELGYLAARLVLIRVDREASRATVVLFSRLGPRYDVLVKGNGPIPRDEIVDALALTDDPLSAPVITAMRQRVLDRLARVGYPNADVELRRVRLPDEGRARIVVDIERGEQVRRGATRFPGATHFSEGFLREQVQSYVEEASPLGGFADPVSKGSLAALLEGRSSTAYEESAETLPDADEVIYEPAYAEAIEHIEDLYMAAGFASAKVGPASVTRDDDGTYTVTLPVFEGPRTQLFRLAIEGNELISTRELAELSKLEAGMPWSRGALEAARKRILEAYAEQGYIFASLEGVVELSADRTRAKVTLNVRERFPVRVGEVVIEGMTRTDESLVRALLLVKPGDIYKPSRARKTQDRLMALGVFRSVAITVQNPELPERVKTVEVRVSEHKNQFLDVRAGLSTAEGIRTGFEYGSRNVAGRAVGLSLRVQLAAQFLFLNEQRRENLQSLPVRDRLERWIGFGVMLPELPRLPYWRTSINLLHMRDNELTFGIDQNRLGITATRRAKRTNSFFVTPAVENNQIQIFDPNNQYNDLIGSDQVQSNPRLQRLLRVPEGRTNLMAVKTGVTLDKRDNVFKPRKGFVGTTSLEWAHTFLTEPVVREDGTTDQFFSHHLSLTVSGTGYIPLSDRLVLALQGQYGRVIGLSDRSETYPNRRFFLGGVDTIRAYQQDRMVPQDVADVANELGDDYSSVVNQGGNTFLLFRAELRFPIYDQLSGGVFTDVGNLWSDPTALNPFKLRPTVGAGIRIETPIGPIALDYGINILYNQPNRRILREDFGAFSFTIGLF
jgi:outer membrane protein insertion porin family